MGRRGVTRPMAQMQSMQHGHDDTEQHGGHMDHGEPYSEKRREMLHMHHMQTLWIYWTLILLGFWQLAAPFSLGYLNPAQWVEPSGGRGVWFGDGLHVSLRAWLMTWSDVVSGLLLIVLGWRSLKPGRAVSLWLACFVGVWLSFAPVVLWSPTSVAYLNDTLVGMLVMALTVLIPGMPNMILYMRMGGETPPGWSYNPSSWAQRWILIVLGLAGLLVSRYLGMFQLGYIGEAWDPFFGSGSRLVLNSDMSHMWPISDGAFGALAYTFEFLMGWMGAPSRWRTMPWMVTLFGILVIPLGLVHIILVISQPVVVGQWCTFCLLAAAIMLPMIPLEVDEVVAMGQHIVRARRRGESGWKVFWKGGDPEGATKDERSPELMELPMMPGKVVRASVWGMSAPWTLVLATLLGLALMFVPWAFGADKAGANVFHVGGALVVVTSVIAMGEVIRLLRWLNVPLGLGLAVLPWFVGQASPAAAVAGTFGGIVIAALSAPRGNKTETYGGWERMTQ